MDKVPPGRTKGGQSSAGDGKEPPPTEGFSPQDTGLGTRSGTRLCYMTAEFLADKRIERLGLGLRPSHVRWHHVAGDNLPSPAGTAGSGAQTNSANPPCKLTAPRGRGEEPGPPKN